MKQQINEIKRMQQLAGIITENEVMTEESKFSNFVKNIFTSKADKEKAASTAIAAEKAAEAAIRLAKSKEEIEKINSLTNDATFKNLLNDYSSKYYEAYFNLENSAWITTGDRANVGYWLHELDPLAKPLKDFLKSKGIDPELIIDFSKAMLTNLQSQKQKTNESRMQQLAGIITKSEYRQSIDENASVELDSTMRDLYNQPLLGGYVLDYSFDGPQFIIHISKSPAEKGQQTKDIEKLGTATCINGKWSFDGVQKSNDDQSTLDKLASLAFPQTN